MKQRRYDVVVLGAGIAGASCALLAAKHGLHVALIDKQNPREASPRPDWLPSQVLALLNEWKVDPSAVVHPPFAGATFHSANLAKHVDTTEAEPPAFRVDYAELAGCIHERAQQAGVVGYYGEAPARASCGEKFVKVVLADRDPVEARFLVRAEGARPSSSLSGSKTQSWVADLHLRGVEGRAPDQLHWILGLDHGRTLACWWFDGALLVARVHASGSADDVRQWLMDCVGQAIEHRWLAGRPRISPEDIALRPAPDLQALEIDSHVGKRMLRIGDAGGFVAASTREGIDPSLRSAALAAETLAKASQSRTPQDVLQEFNTLWRTTMAEGLGSPDAHAPFLLPLVFSNEQMAQRLAATFWRGEHV